MSYDLFFKARDRGSKSDATEFPAYFRERPAYEVTEKQALYQNETTGVYFIFDIGDVGNEEQPYRLLSYSETPDPVLLQLRSLAPTKETPEGLTVDKILNAELVEKARPK